MADLAPIRVPHDFEQEFPGSSRSAAEASVNLVRAADALLAEFTRRRREIDSTSASGFQTLAILEGAGEPLTGQVIAERLIVSSASMTSLLDTLERRALIERHPHPDDRRKVLIHLTDKGQAVVDEMLPAVHAAATEAFAPLSEAERDQLIGILTKLRTQLAVVAGEPLTPAKPRRRTRR